MKRKMPISIKFIGSFVLVLSLISGFFYLYFPSKIREALLEKEITNAKVLIDAVGVGAGIAMKSNDFQVLSLTIKIAKKFPNAKYIVFLDSTGNQMAIYNPENLVVDMINFMGEDEKIVNETNFSLKSNLTFDNRNYGELILNYSLENMNTTLSRYKATISFVSILILFIGTVMAVFLSNLVIVPIKQLMMASQQVIQGNLDIRTNITTNDELGVLGNTFNFMIDNINNATLELKEKNLQLESNNKEIDIQRRAISAQNVSLKKAKKELEEKAQQLELSSKYKSEFLANMSHELRSPLNSLLILSNDLSENKQGNLTGEQVECSTIIYQSGKDLLALINDILDLSKIESGKMTVEVERVNITGVVKMIKDTYNPLAKKRGVALIVEVTNDVPVHIFTDGQRLNQILKNLISNAIKFTEQGNVTVKISLKQSDKLEINVSDTGIGISIDKQKLIFEAFQQAEGGTSRKYGGTGLGLSIALQLAHLLGGDLSLKSELGEGSVFTLTIPINISGESIKMDTNVIENTLKQTLKSQQINETDKKDSVEIDNAVLKNKKVLLVDDDMRNIFALSKILKEYGMEVVKAENGLRALELLEKEPGIDIVLMDIMMPEMNGYEAMAKIREQQRFEHLPVIALTAKAMKEDRQKCIDAGADDYLTKPIDIKTLLQLIQQWINKN